MTNVICTYNPENRGLITGSNNGNYAEYTEFRREGEKFEVRYTDTSNGDMTPYPEWQAVTEEEFFRIYEAAVIESYKDGEA